MATGTYITHYSVSTGQVLGMWLRTTSDNVATYEADGYLSVDGVKVIDSIDGGYSADLAVISLTDPTDAEDGVFPGVYEVDSGASPTDVTTRTDSGRDPEYEYSA